MTNIKHAVFVIDAAIARLSMFVDELSQGLLRMETYGELQDIWSGLECGRTDLLDVDEVLIPAQGHICDAFCMVDSLVVWRLGLTVAGRNSIIGALREALAGLAEALGILTEYESDALRRYTDPGVLLDSYTHKAYL